MNSRVFYYIRLALAFIVLVFSGLAFLNAFYPIAFLNISLGPLATRLMADASLLVIVFFVLILVLTLIFGRFYCAFFCPLGILQEMLMFLNPKHLSYRPNNPYKYLIALTVFGTLIGGTVVVLRLLDPYTLFGSAATACPLGLSIVLIIALLTLFKGRLFCTDICPIGTILGLLAKHALFQIYIDKTAQKCVLCGHCAKVCPTGSIDYKKGFVNNETCVKCLRCLKTCRLSALKYGHLKTNPLPFNPNRRQFLALSGALILAGVLIKSGVQLSQNIARKVKTLILPPGAGNPQDFANRCLNCNLCVENCPMKIIQKADNDYPAVHLDYTRSYCSFKCNTCTSICPSGALKRLDLEQKRKTRLGLANANPKICIQCGMCALECPRNAIVLSDGKPAKVDTSRCIGCGACQNVCPVQAIQVRAIEKQSTLNS